VDNRYILKLPNIRRRLEDKNKMAKSSNARTEALYFMAMGITDKKVIVEELKRLGYTGAQAMAAYLSALKSYKEACAKRIA